MSLRVAIKTSHGFITGNATDSHDSLIEKRHMRGVKEEQHGFTPDGRLFLDRIAAIRWIAVNEKDVFKKLIGRVDSKGLYSALYHEVKGIGHKEPEAPVVHEPSKAPDVSKMKAIVVDYGYHTYMADRLSREYGEVFYYRADWRGFFPTSDKQKVGHGFKNYERILKFWDYVDKADIVIFFSLYDDDLQKALRKMGHTVYGPGPGYTETDKWLLYHVLLSGTGKEDKDLLKFYGLDGLSVNLPVIPTELIVSLDSLKKRLKDAKDLYITPRYTYDRGDMETEHFEDFKKFITVLRELSYETEYEEEEKEFIVRPKVESSCESGYDEFQIDGQSSPYVTMGNENKDETYICKAVKLSELPEALEKIRAAMAPVYAKLGYRGNHSTEVRFDEKGTGLFLDDTCRKGQPPGEIWSELWQDYGANIYQVAKGETPNMKPVAKYAAQINLHSPWLVNNWVPVSYPKEIAPWVKLRNNTVVGGREYCLPFDKEKTLGSVIGLGNTVDEAVKNCLEYLKEFWAHKLYAKEESFEEVKKAMKAGEQWEIKL